MPNLSTEFIIVSPSFFTHLDLHITRNSISKVKLTTIIHICTRSGDQVHVGKPIIRVYMYGVEQMLALRLTAALNMRLFEQVISSPNTFFKKWQIRWDQHPFGFRTLKLACTIIHIGARVCCQIVRNKHTHFVNKLKLANIKSKSKNGNLISSFYRI